VPIFLGCGKKQHATVSMNYDSCSFVVNRSISSTFMMSELTTIKTSQVSTSSAGECGKQTRVKEPLIVVLLVHVAQSCTNVVRNALEYEDHSDKSAAWVAQRKSEMSLLVDKKYGGGHKATFPKKLYEMLSSESKLNSAIIRFLPHGRAFKIYDRQKFQVRCQLRISSKTSLLCTYILSIVARRAGQSAA
jgi:hypothetical protein